MHRERGPGCFQLHPGHRKREPEHGEASFPIYNFWWAQTLLPAGAGGAGSYWNLPEMCRITINSEKPKYAAGKGMVGITDLAKFPSVKLGQ